MNSRCRSIRAILGHQADGVLQSLLEFGQGDTRQIGSLTNECVKDGFHDGGVFWSAGWVFHRNFQNLVGRIGRRDVTVRIQAGLLIGDPKYTEPAEAIRVVPVRRQRSLDHSVVVVLSNSEP